MLSELYFYVNSAVSCGFIGTIISIFSRNGAQHKGQISVTPKEAYFKAATLPKSRLMQLTLLRLSSPVMQKQQ